MRSLALAVEVDDTTPDLLNLSSRIVPTTTWSRCRGSIRGCSACTRARIPPMAERPPARWAIRPRSENR